MQSKSYIAKYNANTKTNLVFNPNFCHCYKPKPMWRGYYATYDVEFAAATDELI